MVERVRSLDIVIEFDEAPPAQSPIRLRTGEPIWSKRLSPMRKHPGRQARVRYGLTKADAWRVKRTIRDSMYRHNRYEHWTFVVRKTDEGVYGVWVTYEGVMTEAEYLASEKASQDRKDEFAARKLAKRTREAQRKALGRTLYNPSLRPPTIDP